MSIVARLRSAFRAFWRELVRKPASPPHVPDPHQVYLHGLGFLVADGLLRTNAEREGYKLAKWIQFPAMVTNAFASELFLKCLLILEGKAHLARGHDLHLLFKRLDGQTQKDIRARWDADAPRRVSSLAEAERLSGATIPRDLDTSLAECGKAFERIRYIFEPASHPIAFYITFLGIYLRDTIRQRTNWTD